MKADGLLGSFLISMGCAKRGEVLNRCSILMAIIRAFANAIVVYTIVVCISMSVIFASIAWVNVWLLDGSIFLHWINGNEFWTGVVVFGTGCIIMPLPIDASSCHSLFWYSD